MVTQNTSTINLSGDGTMGDPLTANVNISTKPLNQLVDDGGLYVPTDNTEVSGFVADEYLETWVAQATPLDRIWTNLCYAPELGLLVITAHSTATDNIMTTYDGIKFTVQTSPTTNNLRGIAWSPSLKLFATVASTGSGDVVTTSPDAVTWTTRSTPADYIWRNMIWVEELGLFVAVGNDTGVTDKVMTSPDGINWTLRTCPDRAWNDLVWAKELGLIVVVASGGVSGYKVMTSPDGISWTLQTTPYTGIGETDSWEGICWSPDLGLLVCVAFAGTSVGGQRVMTSPDGVNWTARTTPGAADRQWLSVAWSPQYHMFAAVANSGDAERVMTSPDGINWKMRTPNLTKLWRRIKWIGEWGRFVACSFLSGGGTGGEMFMMSKPIDTRRQYLNMNGREDIQRVKGAVQFDSLVLNTITAPGSPEDGRIWFDGTDLKIRIGGVTKTVTVT